MGEPYETVAAFTPDRLRTLAGILVSIRHDALTDHHDPGKGDSNWGLGCRVYERTCFAIERAAEKYSWLTVLDHPLHFVFAVGGVPLRFGRGDPDEPNPRLLRRNPSEELAQQAAFEFADDPNLVEWRWRLIVETDPDTLEAARVTLIQVSGNGVIRDQWDVSLPPDFLTLGGDSPPEDAVELPPPSVTAKGEAHHTRTAG